MTNHIQDTQELSSLVGKAIEEQLAKGVQKGYSNWQQASPFHLVSKLIIAVGKGNWKSVLAYAAMLLWLYTQSQLGSDTASE